MPLDLNRDHKITLQRHGAKLWSYNDNKPDVVEAAVLDYLRDHGFDGYFTQRDSYLSLFMTLAGWPGKISKNMPPGFVNPHFVYYNGSDSWLSQHKFTFAQAIVEVDGATITGMTEKIKAFCTGRTSSMNSFSGLKQQPEHMVDFLHALGIERLKQEIKDQFSEEGLAARKFLYDFDTDMRFLYQSSSALSLDGSQHATRPEYIFQCAFHRGGGFETNIDRTEKFARQVKDDALKAKIVEACAFARVWRERTLASYETTTLDLQIWDETGTAIVEVKAPNDRLMRSQTNTIESARQHGERACVIYVSSFE